MKWWMPPVIGVSAVAIANVCLFTAVAHVRPGKVAEHTYASGAEEDGRLAGLHAFASRGWRLDAAVDAAAVTLRLVPGAGPGPASAQVHLYRPDDPSRDREVAWSDPSAPLPLPLPLPGAWQVEAHVRDRAGTVLIGEAALTRP